MSSPLNSGQTSSQHHSTFLDAANQHLYYLKAGQLFRQTLVGATHTHIPILLSTAAAQNNRPKGLLVVSGGVVANTDRNIVSADSDSAVLRSSQEILNGSRWEWHAPISLQGVQLGICKLTDTEELQYELFQFNSSTARTVSFAVEEEQLLVWVNGNKPTKQHSKAITYDSAKNKWYPCVKLEEKGNTVIFLPFSTLHPSNGSSLYNPFSKIQLNEPQKRELEVLPIPEVGLSKIVGLGNDRILLIWENGKVRIIERNLQTLEFEFVSFSVNENQVTGLFSAEEYEKLREWRGENLLFGNGPISLEEIYESIRYLFAQLDKEQSTRFDLYRLLTVKLLQIRPYLHHINAHVPNWIATSDYDIQTYRRALKYFNVSANAFSIPTSTITSSLQWQIEGDIIDVSHHYLITKLSKTLIIYNLQDSVKEVFRESLQKRVSFSKRMLIQNFEERDIRCLKSEGSFLYKILIGCLQKEKKVEETHLVNQNDVKQLIRDYGIPEPEARIALEQTGHVEEALVWIFSEKRNGSKKGESLKDQEDQKVEIISSVELEHMFARLLLQIGDRVFVLGILPSEIKNWLHKSQKEYVDLVTLKHEERIEDINWRNWYSEGRHPQLHILDELITKEQPQFLFKEGSDVYYLFGGDKILKKRLNFNSDHLFEAQPSISEEADASEVTFVAKEDISRTIRGQLISKSVLKQTIEEFIVNKPVSQSETTRNYVKFTLQTKEDIFSCSSNDKAELLPLLIENGPPGCNTNYSISSILHPKGSFLANYPHEITLRHLHNKKINPTTITLHRTIHRKNVNVIKEGTVYFRDEENRTSKQYAFSFGENQTELEISVSEVQYWKYLIIVSKFSKIKKLPFEFGFISLKGHSLAQDIYDQKCIKRVSALLSISNISINSVRALSNTKAQILASSKNIQHLFDTLQSSDKITITDKSIVLRSVGLSDEVQLESLDPETVINYLIPTSGKLESLLRKISSSQTFDFAGFNEKQVYKFMDLVLYYTGSFESEEYFSNIFDKIWANPRGKQYLLNLSQYLTETPVIPLPFLKLLIKKLSNESHLLTLSSIMKTLPKYRSSQYEQQAIKNSKYPHLIFENQFYSNYYFDLVEPKSEEKAQPLFDEPLIDAEIAVFKGEFTRRLVIKLPSVHWITNLTLRVERCDLPCKVNYNVFALRADGKVSVGEGRIQEHQWSLLTKHPHKPEVEEYYGNITKSLNVFGLDVQPLQAQYLQIELSFTETGIVNHAAEQGKVPLIDILPGFYGYPTGSNQTYASIDELFTFNPEEAFFLSVTTLGASPLQKYSVSKDRQIEYLYFKSQQEDNNSIHKCIEQKILKKDYESLVNLQRRLFKNTKKFSHKVCLDYLYTLFILTLNELNERAVPLLDSLCEELFTSIVKTTQGPIKILAFKALSHKVSLLIKSLQYIESELPSLGKISFSYEQLVNEIDVNNTELCQSLTRLILKGVSYEQKWVQLLIKMSQRSLAHEEILAYFTRQEDWLQNNIILEYVASLTDEQFSNYFLSTVSYPLLCRYVLTASAKLRTQTLLQVIVQKASQSNPIDLDVVSLIFRQDEIRWQQLQKVISCCPQAIDTVIHQFLQTDQPEVLADQYQLLLATAALPKYAEEFAIFLEKIYNKDKRILRDVFLSIVGNCTTLHYDFLQTIAQYVASTCDFGGVEGIKLIKQSELAYLQAAVEMLKVVQKIPQGAELPNEQIFIEWYLTNNDYEFFVGNPANKSPSYHLMRQLVESILQLLKFTTPNKVISIYSKVLQKIKGSRRITLSRKHICYNQLHHGATQLLSHTLTSGSLAEVLIGETNPLLASVINELKTSILKGTGKKSKWLGAKQIDITDKFELKNAGQQVKDLQGGKSGSKTSIAKIPISQKILRLESEECQHPNKFVVGFVINDHAENKSAILPSRVQLFGGSSKSLVKIGNLSEIEDQYYLSLGIRLFGINLSSLPAIGTNSIKVLQIKIQEPLLAAASETLDNAQRSKKGATYNISFVNINGFDSQPTEEPDYSQLFVTLLGFLGQPKYRDDLKKVISSEQFDQKLELIIQVLNDLLPNEQIEQLLLALNIQGENVLEHILRLKGANPRLVNLLILGKLTKENISKLISYTLDNLTADYVNIVTLSLRLASYAEVNKTPSKTISSLSNIQTLFEKYQTVNQEKKAFYFELITSLLTVPNLYHYQIGKLITFLWNKSNRKQFYSILAAILPYYHQQLDNFSTSGNSLTVFRELIDILRENKAEESNKNDPFNTLLLLSTLISSSLTKNALLAEKAPIQIVELLKSPKSLLIKYSSETMKQFISFFQSTCISTCCQDEFSEILINMMTSLNDFESIHHQYFIQNFFFPLINAFQGIPTFFVWKDDGSYIEQPTDALKSKPIRSSSKVLIHEGKYYSPLDQIDQTTINSNLLVVLKENSHVLFKLNQGVSTDLLANKNIAHNFKDNKLTLEVAPENILTLPHEKYTLYEESQWESNLLTNSTLSTLKNPWIIEQKYRAVHPIKNSTSQRCYFFPQEMTISQLLKHINISGLRVSLEDIQHISVTNHYNSHAITHTTTLKEVLVDQKLPFLRFEIEASQLFKSTTIESLATEEPRINSFVPQETIFKAFEEKKGLEKLIGVLTGCVKNWNNADQSNIWGQYLKELESYSCFPVFSSLYMTKQSNVSLLFDLLLGLPDKQDSKKWQQREKESVRELYSIIKDVFAVQGQQAVVVRDYAVKSGFYSTMLNRLHLITKEPKRYRVDEPTPEEVEVAPTEKKEEEDDGKAKLIKKKGVGYGNDSSTNQKWDVTGQEQARKEQSEQILGLLKILECFLDYKDYVFPESILEETYTSSLLPIIETSLRGGSLLQISKYAELFQGELSFIQVVARCSKLIPTLMPLSKNYEPRQSESIHSLLKTLQNTSTIFISCLTGSASEKVSEEIAKKIIATYEIVDEAVSGYAINHNDEEEEKKILQMALYKKYPILMKDLRFDYIDMKDPNGKISKHHYSSYYQSGHKPPVEKTVRLAQELADVSHALPIDHTNAIFVRCDKERVDYMQALIMGSNGTPYGHGAYLFDIYFEDTYPNGPPKVNLTTTGNGQIRFNPNLYACGKVCLSLLGTWRGNASENWDAKVSTLLQVLVSIQSIIMSEDIYFNEPGFEHEQGTLEGEKKNQAYANIVRYGNVKFAMTENIKNPPKGFETIIRRHFYLKKEEILEECQRWLKLADKREASYTGLVSDHNYNWCNTFKKSKGEYKTMMEKAVKELQIEISKLPPPTNDDLKKQNSPKKQKKKEQKTEGDGKLDVVLEEIDVSYGDAVREHVELNINDEKVKDRWSRYIGAMGVEAVSKQSKANILLLGLGSLGVEIAKNIVLSGCKQFAIYDDKEVQWSDLSGQFFLSESEIGKPRLESTIYKLQELNHYVKLSKFDYNLEDLSNLKKFQVVIATERNHEELLKVDQYCRENKIHFLSADCYGPYGQIFNDFGDKFEVIDPNGEETTEILIEEITNAEKGILKLAKGQRHPYQDGQTIRISGIKGMRRLSNDSQSINGTLHKVEVISPSSFYIGNTLDYSPYEGDGTARNIKTPKQMEFKSLAESAQLQNIDSNLEYYDFTKGGNLRLLQTLFISLSLFQKENSRLPTAWSKQDAEKLVSIAKTKKADLSEAEIEYTKLFSYTCSGNFGPISALFGGLASQEVFKAITGKYTPINQYFLADFSEIVEKPPQDEALWNAFAANRQSNNDRKEGLRRVIGNDLIQKLENSKVFMIGSGAIGCELLKNFAMLEVGAQGEGSIVVTDPDHIETSNLNRQFLFREKHLRKPKSATAAAAIVQMNPRLKGHVKARLDKVCEATRDIYSNTFFEGLTIVTNALDNVEARRYVDSRCIQNKVALLESGTLSSKGHVQVIIPYKTETYGSKQDPNDANGQIPHCTLKMFPEETLHCVEWARDIFGKEFTLTPKALAKLLEVGESYTPTPSDVQMLKDCLKVIEARPANFQEAVGVAANIFYQYFRNDILQLLYTYPLDAKTKDGKPFWKLPKRPPHPIEEIIPENPLHATFIASYAVLLSKVHNIPFPKDFREPKKREEIAQIAAGFKVQPFVPSDKAAKEMAEEVNNNDSKQDNAEKEKEGEAEGEVQGEVALYDKFKAALATLKEGGEVVESKAEQFQKDEDQNGHIDLIYSMANLRSSNYKLDPMDWINVKLKAGRIMPALSTTTSCIAALQTIELVKYIKGCTLQEMRNAFINLAVPIVTLGQPGPVEKIQVHEKLATNLWERWSVTYRKEASLGEVIASIQEKYGVVVKGLDLLGGGQVYSDIVLGLESKKEERKKALERLIKNVVTEETGVEEMPPFVDFTLVMAVGETLIKHAPTLRIEQA